MGLLKATETFWCRTCFSPRASLWLEHKHHSGSFLVRFFLFLKFPGWEHWCYRKRFSISSICFWAVWLGSTGAHTPPAGWARFSLSRGLGCRWTGEIQASALWEQSPYVSISLNSRQKVIPNTNSETFLVFCNLRCTSLSLWCAHLLISDIRGQQSLWAIITSLAAV